MRRSLRVLGTVLTGLGVLVLLFVAFQVWGTSISTWHAQDRLRNQLAAGHYPARRSLGSRATRASPATGRTARRRR